MDCDRCGNAGTVWGPRWIDDPPAYALMICPVCAPIRWPGLFRYRQPAIFGGDE